MNKALTIFDNWQDVTEVIDFAVPESFISDELSGNYKSLQANHFKSVKKRQVLLTDEPALCNCTVESGCGKNCQNRLLYTYVDFIYCSTLSSITVFSLLHTFQRMPSRLVPVT